MKLFLFAFAALFPVVNPIGTSFVLYGMTPGMKAGDRRRFSFKIALYSFLMLAVFLLFGRYILDLFGISIPSVKVAGGLVLALIGWQVLNQEDSQNEKSGSEDQTKGFPTNILYPYTFPITIGPGCLAVALTLSAHLEKTNLEGLALNTGLVLSAFMAVCALTYLCFANLHFMTHKLGASGTVALTKLLAFFVICIGVEIARSGWTTF